MASEPLALITGAGRGIGRAIALRLSSAGIPVVLVARSSEEITELRNEIVERGKQDPSYAKAYATPCDVTIPSEVNALRDDIVSELGTVNILVNNAGIAPSSKFEAITDEVWRETFAVNVDGAFYMTRAFLPGMITASSPSPSGERDGVRGCHVISNASTAALEGFRYTAAYTASKHALLGLMRALAAEYRKTNVKFSTICPGFTRTQILSEAIQATMSRGATDDRSSFERAEAMFATMNHEGRIIEPEEIAETVYKIITSRNLESGLAYDSLGNVIANKE